MGMGFNVTGYDILTCRIMVRIGLFRHLWTYIDDPVATDPDVRRPPCFDTMIQVSGILYDKCRCKLSADDRLVCSYFRFRPRGSSTIFFHESSTSFVLLKTLSYSSYTKMLLSKFQEVLPRSGFIWSK